MNEAIPIAGVEDFWPRLARADNPCLALDYDGTLAPFQVERMSAVPLPGVVESLEQIRDRRSTRLVIVSGRPIGELLQLLGERRIALLGSHGFERRDERGRLVHEALDPVRGAALERARQLALALGLPAQRVERKAASTAVHTRGMPAERAARIERQLRQRWEETTEQGLHCRAFNGGVELRATGVDKGTALARWLDAQGNVDLAVYLGDDETDEDAFRMLAGRGQLGIRVGGAGMPTAARGRLADCRAVRQFLGDWLEAR